MLNNELFAIHPADLVEARQLSHVAAQWSSKAARANLMPELDDSHSNLGWMSAHFALASHFLDERYRFQLGFAFLNQSLIWLVDGQIDDTFILVAGNEVSAQNWVDEQLTNAGLQATRGVKMPYALPEVNYAGFAVLERQTATLGHWFACANAALSALIEKHGSMAIARPIARCWPHHFDIAALFTLETGDPEKARSIGVGLSPGDETYAEPYFYCSPWPVPDLSKLSTPSLPWSWHTDGFVSLVCPVSLLNVSDDLPEILESAMHFSRLGG